MMNLFESFLTGVNFVFYDIRLHDSQAEENRVQTAGSNRVDESSREALQREENVGRTQRGTLIIEWINWSSA